MKQAEFLLGAIKFIMMCRWCVLQLMLRRAVFLPLLRVTALTETSSFCPSEYFLSNCSTPKISPSQTWPRFTLVLSAPPPPAAQARLYFMATGVCLSCQSLRGGHWAQGNLGD